MRKNLGSRPLSYPQPVFIIASYNPDGSADAMNAAWAGISEHNMVSLCLSATHRTVKNILERKAFTISMGQAQYVKACDYVGLVSGNHVADKFERAGFPCREIRLRQCTAHQRACRSNGMPSH